MEEDGVSYLECLKDAQKWGTAKVAPQNIVKGFATILKFAFL